jgi:hypothetical protein
MKDRRLAFYECSRKWMVEDRKKIMFSNKSHFKLRFANSKGRAGGPLAQAGATLGSPRRL